MGKYRWVRIDLVFDTEWLHLKATRRPAVPADARKIYEYCQVSALPESHRSKLVGVTTSGNTTIVSISIYASRSANNLEWYCSALCHSATAWEESDLEIIARSATEVCQ